MPLQRRTPLQRTPIQRRTALRNHTPLSQGTPLTRSAQIRRVSKKRAKSGPEYISWRDDLMERRNRCEFPDEGVTTIPLHVCWGRLTPHHIVRGRKGIVAEDEIAVLCLAHHGWVEEHPKIAGALGLLRSQIRKEPA